MIRSASDLRGAVDSERRRLLGRRVFDASEHLARRRHGRILEGGVVREHRGLSRSGRLLGVLLADDVGGYCGAGEDRQEGDDETVANAVHAVTFREWKFVPFDRESVQVAGAGTVLRRSVVVCPISQRTAVTYSHAADRPGCSTEANPHGLARSTSNAQLAPRLHQPLDLTPNALARLISMLTFGLACQRVPRRAKLPLA